MGARDSMNSNPFLPGLIGEGRFCLVLIVESSTVEKVIEVLEKMVVG